MSRHGDDALARAPPRVAALTVSTNAGEPVPRDRALERLREHAHRDERVAQVRRAQERVAPARRAGALARRRRRAAEQIASARTAGVGDRLEAEQQQRVEPSPANVSAASRASISRQLDGSRPAWTISRTASSPVAKSGELDARAPARHRRRGSTRTHASVMTPSVPSEPSSSRSGDGPAPDAGSRRDSQTSPRAVTARIDSTRSSMCVGPVAKCPPARVAIQPPSVDSSNDCGKNRSVIPCAAAAPRAAGRSRRPGCARRATTGSTSSTRSSRAEVERHRARVARAGTRVDAADDARPAAVRRRPRGSRRRTTRARARSSTSSDGQRDGVRRVREARRGGRARRQVRGAVGVHGARVGVLGADRGQRRRDRHARRRQLDAAPAPPARPSRSRGARPARRRPSPGVGSSS